MFDINWTLASKCHDKSDYNNNNNTDKSDYNNNNNTDKSDYINNNNTVAVWIT